MFMIRFILTICAVAALATGCGKKHDGKTIGAWQKGLGSEKESERTAAVAALTEIGPEAVPALIEALEDEDKMARRNAAKALGRMGAGAKEAAPALLKALNDDDFDVRLNATEALGGMGADAVPALSQGLEAADATIRRNAAVALTKMGPEAKEALPKLNKALADEDEAVRKKAIAAISAIGDSSGGAATALRDAAGDEDAFVRKNAILALAERGAGEASALGAALSDDNIEIRNTASAALVEMGAAAVPTLIKVLEHENEDARSMAGVTLANIGEDAKDAVPALAKALDDEVLLVRQDVMRALENVGPAAKGAAVEVGARLMDPERFMRDHSLALIKKLGPEAKAALPGMAATFKKGYPYPYCRDLVEVMILVGPAQKDVIAALVRGLDHPHKYVCDSVAKALGVAGLPALEPIKRRLENERGNPVLRYNGTRAIGYMGAQAKEAELFLYRLAGRTQDYHNAGGYANAARGIAGEEGFMAVLEKMLNGNDPLARRGALIFLERGGTKQFIPGLIGVLGEEDQGTRKLAFLALSSMKEAALPELIKAIKYENEFLRGNAAALLGNLGPKAKDAVPALTEVASVWTGWMQKNAQLALKKIEGSYPRGLDVH